MRKKNKIVGSRKRVKLEVKAKYSTIGFLINKKLKNELHLSQKLIKFRNSI